MYLFGQSSYIHFHFKLGMKINHWFACLFSTALSQQSLHYQKKKKRKTTTKTSAVIKLALYSDVYVHVSWFCLILVSCFRLFIYYVRLLAVTCLIAL